MNLREFHIGLEFWCDGGRWRVTDVGTRTVVAIRVDKAHITIAHPDGRRETRAVTMEEAEAIGWFSGPSYGVLEHVFNEDDREGCALRQEEQP